MFKIPINPKAKETLKDMTSEIGRELTQKNINIDKANFPSRLFSFRSDYIDDSKIKKFTKN